MTITRKFTKYFFNADTNTLEESVYTIDKNVKEPPHIVAITILSYIFMFVCVVSLVLAFVIAFHFGNPLGWWSLLGLLSFIPISICFNIYDNTYYKMCTDDKLWEDELYAELCNRKWEESMAETYRINHPIEELVRQTMLKNTKACVTLLKTIYPNLHEEE